jgi:hypothetical protein
MRTIVINRRQVLRGLGGVALGLPFLPSLVPNAVHAQTVFVAPKRFVGMIAWHGGVDAAAMYPAVGAPDAEQTIVADYAVRRHALPRQLSGDNASISGIGTAPASVLTAALAAKLSILRGITIPWYIAHNSGGMLGNYARNDGNGAEGLASHPFVMPTIDQVMARSPSFYGRLDGVTARSMVFGRSNTSWGYQNPELASGPVASNNAFDLQRAYDTLHLESPEPVANPRRPLVDLLLGEYNSLRQSNPRLSRDDKLRLDAHIARLDELGRRINAVALAECRDVVIGMDNPAATGDEFVARQRLMNELVAMAFACGTTRIAVMSLEEENYVPEAIADWHQSVAHRHLEVEPQRLIQRANRAAFEHGFLDLCRRLDVEEQPGTTILDQSLVAWQWECGNPTHDSTELPVYLGGGAGGALRTGLYCDYRDLSAGGQLRQYGTAVGTPEGELRPGLPHNQLLATLLQAMGVPPSEFNGLPNAGFRLEGIPSSVTGYGFAQIAAPFNHVDDNNGRVAATRTRDTMQSMNNLLPFLGA